MRKLFLFIVSTLFLSCRIFAAGNGGESLDGSVNEIQLSVNGTVWTVTLENNKSALALVELLKRGERRISASDYGNFEKVGELGTAIVSTDRQITTGPGDLVLYQGSMITLYYDTNSWNFTLLGKIKGQTRESMLKVLGSGNVEMILALKDN